jgi:hypothetical protein
MRRTGSHIGVIGVVWSGRLIHVTSTSKNEQLGGCFFISLMICTFNIFPIGHQSFCCFYSHAAQSQVRRLGLKKWEYNGEIMVLSGRSLPREVIGYRSLVAPMPIDMISPFLAPLDRTGLDWIDCVVSSRTRPQPVRHTRSSPCQSQSEASGVIWTLDERRDAHGIAIKC